MPHTVAPRPLCLPRPLLPFFNRPVLFSRLTTPKTHRCSSPLPASPVRTYVIFLLVPCHTARSCIFFIYFDFRKI